MRIVSLFDIEKKYMKIESRHTLIMLHGLRRPDTRIGRVINGAEDKIMYFATRPLRKAFRRRGIELEIVQTGVDFKKGSNIEAQREVVRTDIRQRQERDEIVSVGGYSGNGEEAFRLGVEFGIPAVSNNGRLAKGTEDEKPSLTHAARNHSAFEDAVIDFQNNISSLVINQANSSRFLTVGASKDSIVPEKTKSLDAVEHIRVKNRFLPKGLDHFVAIIKGFRDSRVIQHLLNQHLSRN